MKVTAVRILSVMVVLMLMLPMVGVGQVRAGNLFDDLTTTAGGYPTWDSDMINVEKVSQTGKGVYVAVLDTGLVPNWRDYFPEERVATQLGTGFEQSITFKAKSPDGCELDTEVGVLRQTGWVGSTGSTHGTHVASTILGYFYDSNADTAGGYSIPPIVVRGIAPDVTIIPVKVLSDYQIPAMPQCGDPDQETGHVVFGTDASVAAGIRYVGDLAKAGYKPMVINMSLGGSVLDPVEKEALDYAIAQGVIIVASAGNEGEAGMGYPGAYPPVISVGSAGWTKEWLPLNANNFRYRMWWLQSDLLPYTDIGEPTPIKEVYVSDFSSREVGDQDLDVLAPGSWVRGPFAGDPGYSHLPWWSKGIGDLVGGNPGNFFFVGGTSMASPHVAAIAAMMLEKNPKLTQAKIESILESTALKMTKGSATVYDLSPVPGFYTISWGNDAVGSGLVQTDAALAAASTAPKK